MVVLVGMVVVVDGDDDALYEHVARTYQAAIMPPPLSIYISPRIVHASELLSPRPPPPPIHPAITHILHLPFAKTND